MNRRAAVLAVAAWLYLGGIVIQVALAGASLFGDLAWTIHEDLGWGIGTASLLVLLAAMAARLDRTTTVAAVVLTVLGLAQPELAAAREVAPFVAALHPLNSLVLGWLAWTIAWRATHEARDRRTKREGSLEPPEHLPGAGGRGSLEDGTRPRV